ncbi:MAG: MBOAT family protein [Lachnospiraceae bacterium]|nr:MBOAT family protein [Lachnospiraceae bacterium]
MLFTSYEFIGFLLVLFTSYYLIPKKHQWKLLLAFSYLFYFIAGPVYLLYIAATTATIFFFARKIDNFTLRQKEYDKKFYKTIIKSKKWRLLFLALLINLGILAVSKYTNFAIANANSLLRAVGSESQFGLRNIIVPLGISFYTFQALSYLFDVYRGTISAERNFFRFALFVSFFPQLIQGPISRFGDLKKTLFSGHSFDSKQISSGLQRILWGFFKKLVIADRIAAGVSEIIREPDLYGGAYVFVGMLFFALELYADFTGGIDITIGVAEVLGIKVAENFRRPYFSKSIKEFWKRWHISMGAWFTDYVFYPVTVSKPMLRLSKWSRRNLGQALGKRVPIYLSSFIVWFLTGLWHGASWNFIVWGLANWTVIMVSQELEPLYNRFHKSFPALKGKLSFKFFQILRTFTLMCFIRSFNCYRDVPITFKMWGTMVTERNVRILWDGSLLGLGLSLADFIILGFGVLLIVWVSLKQRKGPVREYLSTKPYWVKFVLWYGLFLMVLIFGAYGVGYDASQFIYNQF